MTVELYVGDCLDVLPQLAPSSLDCCVTSPPYWGLRRYGAKDPADLPFSRHWPEVQYIPVTGLTVHHLSAWTGPLGAEPDPNAFVGHLVLVMREVRRVLSPAATLWLNLGDTAITRGARVRTRSGRGTRGVDLVTLPRRYTSTSTLKNKNRALIPSRVALALQADGWILRVDNVWDKPNATPDPAPDRSAVSHEYVFHFSLAERYFYDRDAVRESSRQRSSVWPVKTRPLKGQHSATFPQELADLCVRAGVPPGGRVLDPFFGAGTVGLSAQARGADVVAVELDPASAAQATTRLQAAGVPVVHAQLGPQQAARGRGGAVTR